MQSWRSLLQQRTDEETFMILDELAAYAQKRVSEDKKTVPQEEMKRQANSMPKGSFRFEEKLRQGHCVICEVKKASPSKGIISKDFPYIEVAHEYESSGADCISCLTEPKWFLGSDKIFREIRSTVKIPMLRKDFTVDEYQIYQAKTMGADAVLLICAILGEKELSNYLEICDNLGLTALVETHDKYEIEMAVNVGARVIGVNNRNLKNFSVDTSNSLSMRKYIPEDRIFVAESGITTVESGKALFESGANALLIGEALMRCENKKEFISELKKYAK